MSTTKPTSDRGASAGEGRTQAPLSRDALHGRALAMLARREHSAGEIRDKLREMGGDASLIDAVIAELQVRNLQSDERFSELFVRSRAERGYGPRVIEMALRERGIDKAAAHIALEASGYDWRERAVEVCQRRFGQSPANSPKERARQLRFLQYRGFAGGEIGAALKGRLPEDD